MLKWLASKFMPSNEKLAQMAAEKIANGVNGSGDDKQATIAKYATLGNECAAIATNLTAILKDGNIDAMEQTQIAALIEPLFAKAREIIGI